MIAVDALPTQQFNHFNKPEDLEQLRQDLFALSMQDQNSLDAFLDQLHSRLGHYQDWPQLQKLSLQTVSDYVFELEEETRSRSSSICALANLAVKMIDFMAEEQQRRLLMTDKYESELQVLRYQNDCLTFKNLNIENDIEYFREHLIEAEKQLEIIGQTSSQKEQPAQVNLQKDHQITALQEQLETMREQMLFFTSSAHNNPNPIASQASFDSSVPAEAEQDSLKALKLQLNQCQLTIEDLKRQNYALKNEIEHRQSHHSLCHKIREIKEETLEQSEKRNLEYGSGYKIERGLNSKTNSLSLIHRISRRYLHSESRERLESPNTPKLRFQHENEAQQQNRLHPLNSEWSAKSFEFHFATQDQPHLIDLNQQEEHVCQFNRRIGVNKFQVQETKESEQSIKDQRQRITNKILRATELVTVGTNTDTQQIQLHCPSKVIDHPLNQPQSMKSGLQNLSVAVKKKCVAVYNSLSKHIITARISKSIRKANQSLQLITF